MKIATLFVFASLVSSFASAEILNCPSPMHSKNTYQVDFNKDGTVYLLTEVDGNEPPVVQSLHKAAEVPNQYTEYFASGGEIEILKNANGVFILEGYGGHSGPSTDCK